MEHGEKRNALVKLSKYSVFSLVILCIRVGVGVGHGGGSPFLSRLIIILLQVSAETPVE